MPTTCNRVFIADLIACSTCFGHHHAHHQELKSSIQWLLRVVFCAVVFQVAGLVWSWGLCVRFAGCWFPHINDDARSKSHQISLNNICSVLFRNAVLGYMLPISKEHIYTLRLTLIYLDLLSCLRKFWYQIPWLNGLFPSPLWLHTYLDYKQRKFTNWLS